MVICMFVNWCCDLVRVVGLEGFDKLVLGVCDLFLVTYVGVFDFLGYRFIFLTIVVTNSVRFMEVMSEVKV